MFEASRTEAGSLCKRVISLEAILFDIICLEIHLHTIAIAEK